MPLGPKAAADVTDTSTLCWEIRPSDSIFRMTRTALWPERWPLVAHHVLDDGRTCVEAIDEAPHEHKDTVRWDLPCDTCEMNVACQVAKRKEVGSLMFDREWMTRPRASESTLFPYELWEPLLLMDESMVPLYEKPWRIEQQLGVVTSWDPAWSERTGNDWMVKMTGVIDRKTQRRKIIDILRVQRLTFDQQIHLIVSEHEKFNDDFIVIEADFAQRIWSQYVEKYVKVPVMPHESRTKKDMELGIPGLIVQLEQRLWELPYQEGSYHHEEAVQFLHECEAFGWNGDKLEGVGEHDDTVTAWWHLSHGLNLLSTGAPMRRRLGIQRGVTM